MKILDLENKMRRCVTNTKFLEVEERILIPKTTFIIRIFYLLPLKKKKIYHQLLSQTHIHQNYHFLSVMHFRFL